MSSDTTLITLEQAKTLAELFHARAEASPDRPAYYYFDRAREAWQDLSWREAARETARWRAMLEAMALAPGERVALMLRNRPEWVFFEQAALALGLVVVPLYPEDRPDNLTYILEQTESRVLLVENERQHKRLAQALADLPVRLLNLEQSEDFLPQHFDPTPRLCPRQPDDLATIVYTSGTTGRPKGVMLSHRNLLFNAFSAVGCAPFQADDVFLSFLPLSHTFERTAGYYLPMLVGASVAYARSVQQLGADLMSVQPTVLISVPRVYEQVYLKLRRRMQDAPRWRRWLFEAALAVGGQVFEYEQGRAAWRPAQLFGPLLRRLVGHKLLNSLGGRIRLAICGGAPLSFEIARTFVSLGLPLYQGYGLTEASPVISVNRPESNLPASIGQPLPGVEVRLGDNNELLSKSPSVMLGYWRDPQATSAMIDADGWLHTGDRARLDEYGHLYITGRIKDIIVMSNGEKVSPQDMELAITTDPLFVQVLLVGEGRPYLAALAALNPELWPDWARGLGLAPDHPHCLQDKSLRKAALARISELTSAFPGYAQIRRVTLFERPWSVEDGLLTPTLKLKRNLILQHCQPHIEAMYQ